ncbi:MAG TPA: heme ABC exporter ATP-binding protein CcmA [Anaerolineales bacterium]|nr:heme ABC exporter ATP-binding protein CcmA [Anaerolineales bacterium]
MIEVRSLIKTFGLKPVLRGVDLRLEAGEFVALLGPNGAGKTTLLRILASLARPSLGEVNIAGHRLPAEAAQVRRLLGVVSHQPLLYGDLTAEENLWFYARLYDLPAAQRRINEILEMVGLDRRRRDRVREYSRGMQQRLTIGRAVLHDPKILLFDEPHTGLDQEASAMLDGVLRQVAGQGRTVLMTSHDLLRAADLASRIDILSGGVIARSLRRGQPEWEDLPTLYRAVAMAEGTRG